MPCSGRWVLSVLYRFPGCYEHADPGWSKQTAVSFLAWKFGTRRAWVWIWSLKPEAAANRCNSVRGAPGAGKCLEPSSKRWMLLIGGQNIGLVGQDTGSNMPKIQSNHAMSKAQQIRTSSSYALKLLGEQISPLAVW